MAKTNNAKSKTERRTAKDRRTEADRRAKDVPVAKEARQGVRRKVQRRRQIDPTTCERDYTNDEIEFMHALDAYKRSSGRMFPTCSEILEVIRALGYERVTPAGAATPPAAEISVEATVGDAMNRPGAETSDEFLQTPADGGDDADEAEESLDA